MDIFIDPLSGDYILDQGALGRDPLGGLANAAYIRLTTPLGSYWADPQLGSRLHELQREKDVARVGVLARQYALAALKPLQDDGRAAQIDITVERVKDASAAGRLQLGVTLAATSGEVTTFALPLKVI
jgi:phage gp46-like protein